ncbi:hypothetical protein [Actinomarinicola tropica]|uniref:hypothetical protein n=1 Tax=Actinomarinicola tropica TaxID=2789776 RepID=UPI00189B9FF6|nr:hypothetical protein [Actinomarinicola tropica]
MSDPQDETVPDADAQEQSAEVDPAGAIDQPTRDPEAPEADAWEQAQELPEPDEDTGPDS